MLRRVSELLHVFPKFSVTEVLMEVTGADELRAQEMPVRMTAGCHDEDAAALYVEDAEALHGSVEWYWNARDRFNGIK